jgi:hypothetical protein
MDLHQIKIGDRLQYSQKPYGKTLYGVVLSVHKTHIVFKFDNIRQSRQFVTFECLQKCDE